MNVPFHVFHNIANAQYGNTSALIFVQSMPDVRIVTFNRTATMTLCSIGNKDQSINQSINQSIDRSINQSINPCNNTR